MKIDILTLIPGMFKNVFDESILGAAVKNDILSIETHSFREFGDGRHKTVDDTAFGGGPGMILKPGPLVEAIRDLRRQGNPGPVIGLTPQGVPFTQSVVRQLAGFSRIILVCGRYEGFDERIRPEFDLEMSIGDYVLTGGEFPAMIVIDAVARMLPGAVGCRESVEHDSFFTGPLDHPQFTRPPVWEGASVPEILTRGHHRMIEDWRRGKSLVRTAIRRPDVFSRLDLTTADGAIFQECLNTAPGVEV
ncbi:MAG: tRNA (guanosine(37)-N1)-methyltransferase TrmD [Candidatus Riflebacteria bacterium]|nr:tRNA (guanosine(37)-N1)-methyltransferase TrmD [Candidatus Riflebacteria bacterium]